MAITSLVFSKTVVSRKCLYFNECGKLENYNGKWQEHWYNYNGGFICRPHYRKIQGNPKYPKEYKKKYNDRQILFLGKVFSLSWIIRKGCCSWCHNNIF